MISKNYERYCMIFYEGYSLISNKIERELKLEII